MISLVPSLYFLFLSSSLTKQGTAENVSSQWHNNLALSSPCRDESSPSPSPSLSLSSHRDRLIDQWYIYPLCAFFPSPSSSRLHDVTDTLGRRSEGKAGRNISPRRVRLTWFTHASSTEWLIMATCWSGSVIVVAKATDKINYLNVAQWHHKAQGEGERERENELSWVELSWVHLAHSRLPLSPLATGQV